MFHFCVKRRRGGRRRRWKIRTQSGPTQKRREKWRVFIRTLHWQCHIFEFKRVYLSCNFYAFYSENGLQLYIFFIWLCLALLLLESQIVANKSLVDGVFSFKYKIFSARMCVGKHRLKKKAYRIAIYTWALFYFLLSLFF